MPCFVAESGVFKKVVSATQCYAAQCEIQAGYDA
jgi:hypothetical protein